MVGSSPLGYDIINAGYGSCPAFISIQCGLLREDEKNACKYYNYGTDPWILCFSDLQKYKEQQRR